MFKFIVVKETVICRFEVKRTSLLHSSVNVFSTLVLIEDTILRLFSENGRPSFLSPAVIRATYRATEQFVGHGRGTVEPLFKRHPLNTDTFFFVPGENRPSHFL